MHASSLTCLWFTYFLWQMARKVLFTMMCYLQCLMSNVDLDSKLIRCLHCLHTTTLKITFSVCKLKINKLVANSHPSMERIQRDNTARAEPTWSDSRSLLQLISPQMKAPHSERRLSQADRRLPKINTIHSEVKQVP